MARTASSRPAEPQPDSDLSEAARAVIHDAGDPRIDAHLAAMGLGPDPVPTSARKAGPTADAAELTILRDRVASLELELATTITRSNVLATLLALAILVILVLVALLVL